MKTFNHKPISSGWDSCRSFLDYIKDWDYTTWQARANDLMDSTISDSAFHFVTMFGLVEHRFPVDIRPNSIVTATMVGAYMHNPRHHPRLCVNILIEFPEGQYLGHRGNTSGNSVLSSHFNLNSKSKWYIRVV